MDSMSAFAMGQLHRNDPAMVFDWDKAAKLIKQYNASEASAGLKGDWEWTGGTIFQNGKPLTSDYTFLESTWAIPQIEIDGMKKDCWKPKEGSGWDSDTKWPESALAILNSKE